MSISYTLVNLKFGHYDLIVLRLLFLFLSRHRNFYGERVKMILQSPGDTLFMPHAIHHLVYNLDTRFQFQQTIQRKLLQKARPVLN